MSFAPVVIIYIYIKIGEFYTEYIIRFYAIYDISELLMSTSRKIFFVLETKVAMHLFIWYYRIYNSKRNPNFLHCYNNCNEGTFETFFLINFSLYEMWWRYGKFWIYLDSDTVCTTKYIPNYGGFSKVFFFKVLLFLPFLVVSTYFTEIISLLKASLQYLHY